MIPSGEALDQVAFSEALSKAGGTALVAPNAEAAGLARISNVVAEAVAMALPGPESDEEMSLQVLVDRIVDELFGEAGLDTGDSEFLLELLETRYPAAQQQDNGDADPAAAGRGWPSLGVLLSSLVRMPEAAGNTNDTVQILKSLLGLTDEKAPSLGKADGSAQAVGITDGKAQALGIADRKNPAPRPSDDQPRNDRGAAIAELASRIRTSLTSALPGRQDVETGANGEVRSGGNGPLEPLLRALRRRRGARVGNLLLERRKAPRRSRRRSRSSVTPCLPRGHPKRIRLPGPHLRRRLSSPTRGRGIRPRDPSEWHKSYPRLHLIRRST